MFCSKKIKALKQEIRFQKIDLEGKNNILRVTLNDNRRLQKLLKSLKKTSWDSYKKLKERENVSI